MRLPNIHITNFRVVGAVNIPIPLRLEGNWATVMEPTKAASQSTGSSEVWRLRLWVLCQRKGWRI